MDNSSSKSDKHKASANSKDNQTNNSSLNLEAENFMLKQQLNELEFYKTQVSWLRNENFALIEEKQRLDDLLTSSRSKEEEVIERLVETQMLLDEAQATADAERKAVEAQNKSIQSMKVASANDTQARDQFIESMQQRLNDLERDREDLRIQLKEARNDTQQKENKWKFLELQKEKLEIRRELQQTRKELKNYEEQSSATETRIQGFNRQLQTLESSLIAERQSYEEHKGELELRVEQLTQQVMLLRRKGSKLATNHFKDLELTETEIMYKSLQELTTQMARLKNNNKILRKSCDKLKRDVDNIITIEDENDRLKRENRELRQLLSSKTTNIEQSDEYRSRNLQLEIENKKLRRIVESLRNTLLALDPHNRSRYHYITSI